MQGKGQAAARAGAQALVSPIPCQRDFELSAEKKNDLLICHRYLQSAGRGIPILGLGGVPEITEMWEEGS